MSSNLAWGLRTAFALVAFALVTVIMNGRAADGREERTQRLMREAEPVILVGETFRSARASAMFDHDVEELYDLSFALRLRCMPAHDPRLFAYFSGLVVEGPGDRLSDGALRVRRADAHARLALRQRGTATLAVDARYDAHRLTGTASTRVTLDDGAVCRADDVPLRLARQG